MLNPAAHPPPSAPPADLQRRAPEEIPHRRADLAPPRPSCFPRDRIRGGQAQQPRGEEPVRVDVGEVAVGGGGDDDGRPEEVRGAGRDGGEGEELVEADEVPTWAAGSGGAERRAVGGDEEAEEADAEGVFAGFEGLVQQGEELG